MTHLFFLSSPLGTVDYPERVRTTWEHVRSSDLVEWEELPAAVAPGGRGEVDGDGVWTGSVVERDGVFHLFYTGHRVGAERPQTICVATSRDLVRFEKSPENPVLVAPEGCELVDWRDPYVFFNEGEGLWWMVVAARLAEGPVWTRGCLMLATSADLVEWTVEPEPLYVPGTTYCPECPELWPLEGRWYLVYSRFSEQAGTIYRVADSPRGPFRVPANDELGGRRWYAAKSCPTVDGRGRVFFGWLHERDPDTGRWCWGGDFAAPREVVPTPDGELRVRLPDQLQAAFNTPVSVARPLVELDAIGGFAHQSVGLEDVPASYLARFEFSWEKLPAGFGVTVRCDEQLAGWRVGYDRVRGTVNISRQPHPLDDFWADLVGRGQERREVDGPFVAEARIPTPASPGTLTLTLLVEGSVLEVYINDQAALTHRINPPTPTTTDELATYTVDGTTTTKTTITTT